MSFDNLTTVINHLNTTNYSNATFNNEAAAAASTSTSWINQFIITNIDHFERTLYILYIIIFMLGVVGNSIVIYVLMSSIFLSRPAGNVIGGATITAGGGGGGRRGTAINPSTMSPVMHANHHNAHLRNSVAQSITLNSSLSASNNSYSHASPPTTTNSNSTQTTISRGVNNNSFRHLVKRNDREPAAVANRTSSDKSRSAGPNHLNIDEDSIRKQSNRTNSGMSGMSDLVTTSNLIQANHDRSNSLNNQNSIGFRHVSFF